MNPSFLVGLVLSVPLAILANLLTPKISLWWANRSAQRRQSRIAKLEKELAILRRDAGNPVVDAPSIARGADNAPFAPPASPSLQVTSHRDGHSSSIEQLFKTSDRWTTIVYTCRATFTGEQCFPEGTIKKALWTHVPVDEVQTVSVAINHLLPAEFRKHEEDILHTVICSKRAEEFLFGSREEADSRTPIPPLHERDLIVVGENNLSNLLLAMVQCYLPWNAGTGQKHPKGMKPRPDVYLELVSRFERYASADRREIHKGGGMIALIPSPLNVRKRVLILFGCHREGQFALEDWLRGSEVGQVVEDINNKIGSGTNAIQIALDRDITPPPDVRLPLTVHAIRNLKDGRRFWCTQLSPWQLGDTAVVNAGCSTPHELYDISLVVPLAKTAQDELETMATDTLKIPNLYWENRECEIGFHITLFEFLTHQRPNPDLQNQVGRILPRLCDAFKNGPLEDVPSRIIARVRGFEFLPTAMICYVDFLDEETDTCCAWLDRIRSWCERSVESAGLTGKNGLNAMRIPFPVHITLCRFNRKLQESEQDLLRRTAAVTRNRELMRFPIDAASLTVARKSPYRGVSIVETVQLQTAQTF